MVEVVWTKQSSTDSRIKVSEGYKVLYRRTWIRLTMKRARTEIRVSSKEYKTHLLWGVRDAAYEQIRLEEILRGNWTRGSH